MLSYTYDGSGNPLSYYNGADYTFTWEQGRQLASVTKGNKTASYTYDMSGVRSSKTVNGVSYEYTTLSGKITRMTWSGNAVDIVYDDAGRPYILRYTPSGGATQTYYYVLNLQGDVVGLMNTSMQLVVRYSYDPWGKLTGTTATSAYVALAQANPLRYRSYCYDIETGFYYLQTRYYDPAIARFINADGCLTTNSLGLLSYNMFAYCKNNPVNKADYNGREPGDLFDTMDEAARDFAEYINPKSIEDNREYASYIYTRTVIETKTVTYVNPNAFGDSPLSWLWSILFGASPTKTVTIRVRVTKYTYVEPKRGTNDSSSPPINWFGLHNVVARLHTHAAYDPKYDNDVFSPADKRNARNQGVPTYVATPLGTLRKYNPANGTDIIIYDDIPFDPNHPGR